MVNPSEKKGDDEPAFHGGKFHLVDKSPKGDDKPASPPPAPKAPQSPKGYYGHLTAGSPGLQ
jgi:hypothetical protein